MSSSQARVSTRARPGADGEKPLLANSATEPSPSLGLQPLVDGLLRGIAAAVNADRATLTRIADESSVIIEGSFDMDGAPAEAGRRWLITAPEMRRLVFEKEPVVQVLDPALLPDPFRDQLEGVRHLVILPLTVAGEVFGTIAVSRRQDRPFESHDMAVLRDLGNVAVLTLRNAVELARAEAVAVELRSSEERFRLLVDGVKDYAIFMLDPDGQVTSWNQGAERIKGYRAREIIGRHFSAFYLPKDVATGKPSRALETAARLGVYEEEGWRLRKDGTRFMASVLITALRDPSGRLRGFAKVTRDITEKRRMQDRLLKAERREAVKFHELADRMAILERTKSQFLNLASHELRTPVSLIRGYVSLFKEGDFGVLNENGTRAVSVLNDQTLQLDGLVNQMLQAARLQSGAVPLRQEDVDLRDLVSRALERFRELAGADHSVALSMHSKTVPVRADPEMLSAILHNLLDNAVKYSPNGGAIECEVRADRVLARVKVRDQGIGIEPDQEGMLFQQFGRVVNTDTAAIGGAGLGLYLAREMARLHGGDVSAETDAGPGSTFVLTLPLRAVERPRGRRT